MGRPRKEYDLSTVLHLLGQAPDAEIASTSEIPAYLVTRYRRAAGIAAPATERATRSDSKLREHEALIGTLPDGEVAKLAGVSRQAVAKTRARLAQRKQS